MQCRPEHTAFRADIRLEHALAPPADLLFAPDAGNLLRSPVERGDAPVEGGSKNAIGNRIQNTALSLMNKPRTKIFPST